MGISLSNEVRALLDRPNFAHLATLLGDGSPQSAPVWVEREGDRILIGAGEGTLKAKNTKRDPRVSLSVVDFHNPYEEAQIQGRVIERRPDSPGVMNKAPSTQAAGGVILKSRIYASAPHLR